MRLPIFFLLLTLIATKLQKYYSVLSEVLSECTEGILSQVVGKQHEWIFASN